VRFSQDVEGRDELGYFPEGEQHQDLRIDTAGEGGAGGARGSPGSFHTASGGGLSPTSPVSPRARDRGYSLRRALFTRNATQRSDTGAEGQHGIELAPSSSGNGRENGDNEARMMEDGRGGEQRRQRRERAGTGASAGSGKSEGDSSLSETKKGSAKASRGEDVLPNFYSSLSMKKSRLSAVMETLARYQTNSANFIFRRKPIPPSKDGRHIDLDASRTDDLIDERTGKPYIGNTIRSSRYTIWDFIPRQLFFQFSKLANAYFLIVGILQLIPGLSTIGSWTTIAPLCVFVALSMAKEGYDDVRRYNLDQVENKKVVS
jgi:phospholipid-translocating ATPase